MSDIHEYLAWTEQMEANRDVYKISYGPTSARKGCSWLCSSPLNHHRKQSCFHVNVHARFFLTFAFVLCIHNAINIFIQYKVYNWLFFILLSIFVVILMTFFHFSLVPLLDLINLLKWIPILYFNIKRNW